MDNVTDIEKNKKGWFSRHSEDIVFGMVCLASVVVPIGMGLLAARSYNKQEAIRQEKIRQVAKSINEAIARGDTVLPGGEFGVWVIPKNKAS